MFTYYSSYLENGYFTLVQLRLDKTTAPIKQRA